MGGRDSSTHKSQRLHGEQNLKIIIAAITARTGKSKLAAFESLTDEYLKRMSQYCKIETHHSVTEQDFLVWMEKRKLRPFVVLLDQEGKQLSSEGLAGFIRSRQNSGTQEVMFAVGPANGWSERARKESGLLLSFGKITLPHEMAKVVLLEQIYRSFTILNHHPYHRGH